MYVYDIMNRLYKCKYLDMCNEDCCQCGCLAELDCRKLYAGPHGIRCLKVRLAPAHDAIDEGGDDQQITHDHRERGLFR